MSENEGTTTLSYLEFRYMTHAYNLYIKITMGVRSGPKYASISNYVSSRNIHKYISYCCPCEYVANIKSRVTNSDVVTSFPHCQFPGSQRHTDHRSPN